MNGTAGSSGPDVRGDCMVVATPDGKGMLSVKSRVAALYGPAIRTQVQEVLCALGGEGITLQISDEGALPYVIGARIEAAVKRAVPDLRGLGFPRPPKHPAVRSPPCDLAFTCLATRPSSS